MRTLSFADFSKLLRTGFEGEALFSGKVQIQDSNSVVFRASGTFRMDFDRMDRYHSIGLFREENRLRICRDEAIARIDFRLANPRKIEYSMNAVPVGICTQIHIGRLAGSAIPVYSLRIEPGNILY